MDSKYFPLLGDPKRMFEDDNIYVISEKAEKGRTYSIVCPRCHSVFFACTRTDEVMKVKCPDCDTYICFSSHGNEKTSIRMRTKAISPIRDTNQEGILIWEEHGKERKWNLELGETIIGRQDKVESSDISLCDEAASRRSIKLSVVKGEKSGNFTFMLSVLRTTNAVYVNNNALYTGSSIYLNYGDRFKVGETVFVLVAKEKL